MRSSVCYRWCGRFRVNWRFLKCFCQLVANLRKMIEQLSVGEIAGRGDLRTSIHRRDPKPRNIVPVPSQKFSKVG
jgi:hypothetical protein